MSEKLLVSPPFHPASVVRRLAASVMVQRVLWTLIVMGWLMGLSPRYMNTYWPDGLMIAALAGWFLANYASAAVARLSLQVAQLSAVEAPTPQIEHLLAQALPRFTLYRNIRYLLHHQLAVLRHRQHRYNESAWIAATLLEQLPDGRLSRKRIEPLRVKLLILLADAAMFQQQLPAAYAAMSQLMTHRLDLTQMMQVLEIQTRYQLAIGYTNLALSRLPQKLEMVDLMPLPHAIQMHQLFALAAEADGRPATADYLRRRGELLTPGPGNIPTP